MAGLVPFNRKLGLKTNTWDDFYNMLDDFFSDNWPSRSLFRDTFKLDIHENDREYCVEADLPGINKDEIELEFCEGRLTIKVSREEQSSEEQKNYVHRERRVDSMQRSIYLADAAADGINARLDNGVLNISVPKQKRNDPTTRINID